MEFPDSSDVFAYSATILIIALVIIIIFTIIFLISGSTFVDSVIYASMISVVASVFVIVGLMTS